MSPKKTILKTLLDQGDGSGYPALVRPSNIPGFQQAPDRYQKTINALLKERLIEGEKDGDGRLAISLNAHRARDIRRAVRPIWAHPALLTLLALVAAAAGLGFLI